MGGKFDLSLLGVTSRALFPNLVALHLTELEYDKNSSAKVYAAAVHYHCPEMNPKWGFHIESKGDFEKAVRKAYHHLCGVI